MNYWFRIKNAYLTGGIKEIFRKLYFKSVYKRNNRQTKQYVDKTALQFGVTREKREIPIIVSMTSFPPRFSGIGICLKSLCLQTVKPDKIIVYFGSDVSENQITEEMRQLESFGVEYVFVKNEDLKPHKKYYYALSEFPAAIIITVDDDVYYPRDWLEKMVATHMRYPNSVCAWRVHKMKKDDEGLLNYNRWIDQYRREREPSFSLFPTGVGGVLYPPNCFDKRVLNKELFSDLCLRADDVWLKIMYTLNGVKTVWVPNNEVEF